MGCPECSRLSALFTGVIHRLSALRAKERRDGVGVDVHRAIIRELDIATAELIEVRELAIRHEAFHGNYETTVAKHPKPN